MILGSFFGTYYAYGVILDCANDFVDNWANAILDKRIYNFFWFERGFTSAYNGCNKEKLRKL